MIPRPWSGIGGRLRGPEGGALCTRRIHPQARRASPKTGRAGERYARRAALRVEGGSGGVGESARRRGRRGSRVGPHFKSGVTRASSTRSMEFSLWSLCQKGRGVVRASGGGGTSAGDHVGFGCNGAAGSVRREGRAIGREHASSHERSMQIRGRFACRGVDFRAMAHNVCCWRQKCDRPRTSRLDRSGVWRGVNGGEPRTQRAPDARTGLCAARRTDCNATRRTQR